MGFGGRAGRGVGTRAGRGLLFWIGMQGGNIPWAAIGFRTCIEQLDRCCNR